MKYLSVNENYVCSIFPSGAGKKRSAGLGVCAQIFMKGKKGRGGARRKRDAERVIL